MAPTNGQKQLETSAPAQAETELNELDLLGDGAKAADLSLTVDAFAVRMQQRKRERELAEDSAEQEARLRQELLMKAMVKIRRSLEEVVRIDLGDRFRLCLEKDDVNGWPRLTIRLKDRILANADYPMFQVVSHDRHSRGIVEISYGPGTNIEALSLIREADAKRLPLSLKKSVRAYLDAIGDLIICSESLHQRDEDEEALKEKQVVAADPIAAASSLGTSGDEFFDQSFGTNDGFETLPELDEVKSLASKLE